MRITKVTIIREHIRPQENINDLLLLLGQSLGLFSLRDKDKSCYRIFIILVKALKASVELTSDDLAIQTGLSRGTVIHHLNRLMDAGIVTNYKNKYFIDYSDLTSLVADMRATVNTVFNDIESMASRIDAALSIKKPK